MTLVFGKPTGGSGGGASDFTSLSDTPSSYSGQGGKATRVNAGESAVEFYTPTDANDAVKVSSNDTTAGFLNGKLLGGTNVTLVEGTDGGNETLTIDASVDRGITWNEVTGTTQAASVNAGYIANNAALVTITIPTTAAVGDVVRVTGKGAGGWKIAQNASEIIHFLGTDTTTGTGGSLASTGTYDGVEIVCVVANTEWVVASSMGNITIV